ncbi:MAG: alpha/beta hydrolase [Myxococcota bacterium]|jgi:pimeloyl-ACP methyl ester carboxylesterase|nr:alpha/beta hydrolase [Myxococcota bacterium]
MAYLERNGRRLHFELDGSQGSPVLMLMGFGMSIKGWLRQRPALASSHRLVLLDNAGIGGSDPPPRRRWSMRDMAADALTLVDALELPSVHVVGVSMGGMIAQQLALDAPERVRSLSLVVTHPGGRFLLPPLRGLRLFAQLNFLPIGRLARSPKLSNSPDGAKPVDTLLELLFPMPYIESRREELQRLFSYPPSPAATRLSQLWAVLAHQPGARLSLLSAIPSLVVGAAKDVLIEPKASEVLASRINAQRFVLMPQAGHGVMFQCHEALNRHLLEHFAETDATQQAR